MAFCEVIFWFGKIKIFVDIDNIMQSYVQKKHHKILLDFLREMVKINH
jgi:hypothetical protein